MKFDCSYPPEIVEWAKALPEAEECTAQQLRISRILDDPEVSRAAANLFAKKDFSVDQEFAKQRINDFWSLIEDAAAVPDENPPGSVLRTEGETLTFLTPAEIRRALTDTATQALKLNDLISRTAPTVAEDSKHLKNLSHMKDQLVSLHDLCVQKLNQHAAESFGEKDFPIGSTAGKNEYRNWLLRRVTGIAEVRLGHRDNDLILAVHCVLAGLDEQMNERTAAGEIGKPSFLDPAFAECHSNTFNTWALNNNYPTKSID